MPWPFFLAHARARAFLAGRGYVTPDAVKTLAIASLAHRLILRTQTQVSGMQKEAVACDFLDQVQVPR